MGSNGKNNTLSNRNNRSALFCPAALPPDTRSGAGRAGGSPPVGGIDIACISPNGFVLPFCRRRLAKPVLTRTNSPAGASAAVVVPDRFMRGVKSRTGLQPPSLSRVSIAPAGGIGKQSLVYPHYSRRRAASRAPLRYMAQTPPVALIAHRGRSGDGEARRASGHAREESACGRACG